MPELRVIPAAPARAGGPGRISKPVELRRVESPEAAVAERFLSSPSVRIDGADLGPGADARHDFGLKCRLYTTADGQRGRHPMSG